MRIGIIGAGFIGCNLSNYYLKKNNEVIIFDNLSRKGTHDNIKWLHSQHTAKKLKIYKSDIRYDYKALKNFAKDCDVIFHLAAQVAVTTSVTNPRGKILRLMP